MADTLHAHLVRPRLLGYRKNGCPIWSIAGAEDSAPAATAGQPAGGATGTLPSAGTGGETDKGYPDNTPVAEMSYQQQAAYFKAQSRKHEDRVKAYGGVTAEQLADLKSKAEQHDKLERELMSDKDKAIAEAKDTAEKAARDEYAPKLVAAEFRAAAAGRIDADKLATILEPLDMGKFLTSKGDVDTDRVSKYVEGIAPATGTAPTRRGPTATGHTAALTGQPATGKPGEAGAAMAEKRFGKKN